MSAYTTEVRYICEALSGVDGSVGFPSVNEIISKAIPKIFSFDFPIFDASYRTVLCAKILRHYYTREIGLETYSLWKLKLETKLTEIMPYYNQLYESARLKFNPFDEVDLTRTHSGKSNGNSSGGRNTTRDRTENENGGNDGTHWNLYSDTPQGGLVGVENQEYLTNASKDTDVGKYNRSNTDKETVGETNNSTASSTDEYVNRMFGKMSTTSYSKLLIEYRDTLINIDMMVIDELKDLFMLIW